MTELTAAQQIREKKYAEACEHLLLYNGVKEFPKMGNMTASRLVDMVGVMKVIEADAKKTIQTLNGIIDSKLLPEEKMGDKAVVGDVYSMKITPVTQRRLKEDLAKARILVLAKAYYGLAEPTLSEEELGVKAQSTLNACMYDLDMSQHRYTAL